MYSDQSKYVCSNCGAGCYYDGRCGDGPILYCECSRQGTWYNDGRGGYMIYPNDARPVPGPEATTVLKNWK